MKSVILENQKDKIWGKTGRKMKRTLAFLSLTHSNLGRYVAIVLSIIVFSLNVAAQDINYKSQSLFIYVFTKNITWPSYKINAPEFRIGVYGNSPIMNELEVIASLKKAANGKKITVHKIEDFAQLSNFHILYIASSKSRELSKILESLKKEPVLVVAERDGLARKGASINFIVTDDNYLKFEVNREALRNHNLSMNDELLQQGFIVK